MGNSLGLMGAVLVSFGVPSALVTLCVRGLRHRLLGVALGVVVGVLAALICSRLTSAWLFVIPPHPPSIKFGNGPGLAGLFFLPVTLTLYVLSVMWAVVLTFGEASFVALADQRVASDGDSTDEATSR